MAIRPTTCAECGTSYIAGRKDSTTCSTACRSRRHRAQRSARESAQIRTALDVVQRQRDELDRLRAALELLPED